MIARIWIVLLAALLLAAPADSTFEIADAMASISLADEDGVTNVPVELPETIPERIVCTPPLDAAAPLPTALARIFRPPRASLG